MEFMKEVSFIFDMHIKKPESYFKVFGDNQSFIAVMESHKFSIRKKHISFKYNHLQSFVYKKIIWMWCIDTGEQKVENFTKQINKALLIYL